MAGFDDPTFYGDRWAAVYDEHHARADPAPAVEFLAGLAVLAGDGRVLELAIGTGRGRCRWRPGGSPWRDRRVGRDGGANCGPRRS